MAVSYNCTCDDSHDGEAIETLRGNLMRRLGFGAQVANPPPGMTDLLNSFLQDAQATLYRRYDVLRTERFFSWPLQAGVMLYDLPENNEAATIPTPVAPALSTSAVGGTLAAGTYSYRITAVNANGETLASTAATQITTGATSTVTVTFPAVVVFDGSAQTGWKVYGRTGGSELLLATVGLVTDWTDDGSVTPAGALPTVNTTYVCSKLLDPRKLTWVGIERDGVWSPLISGIPPELYSHTITGRPERYEIRQCIEVWPTPDETDGNLVIKGRFGLEPFATDGDTTTIDGHAVFLLALANAKAHYRQPDANNYVAQLETYMLNMVAGAHGTRRYIPGRDHREDMVYVAPKPTVPFP